MSIISSIDCSEKVLEDEKWLKVMALGVTLSFKIMENKQDLRARNRHLSSDQFSSYFMTYNFNYLGQLHMKLLYACHDDKIAILAILIRVPPSYFALQSQMLAKLIRACLNDIDDTYSHSVKKYLILMLAYKKLNNLLQHDSKHLATWKTSFNEKFADQRIPALIVQFLKAQYPLIKKSFAQSLLHVPTSIEVIYNNFQKFERQNMYIPSVVYPPFDKNCKDGVIKRLNESTADATFSDKNSRATSKISNKKRRKNLNTESDDNVVMIIKNLQNFPTSYLLSGNLVTKNHERLYYEDQLKINKISTKSLSVNENIFETNKAEKSGTSQKLHLFNTEKMINTDQVNVVSNILPKISSQELLTIGNQTNLKNLSKTNLKEKENIDSGIIKSKNEVSSELKNSDEIQISMENDIEKGVNETIEKSKTNKELISSEEKIDSEIKENKNLGNFEKSKKIQITEDKQVVESSEKGNDKEREKKFMSHECNDILKNVTTETVNIDQQVLSDDLNEEKIEGNDKEVGKEIMSHETNKILENASTENVKIKINQQVLLDDLNEEKIKGNGKERQKEIMSHERNDILKNVSTENVNIDQHVLSENLNEKSVKENNKEVKKEFTPLETKEILENVSTENVKIKINQQVLSNDLNEEKIERNDKEVEKQIMSLETNDILKNVSTENVNIKIDQEVLSGVSNEEKVEENNKVKKEFTPLETNEILGNVSTENVKIKIDQQVLSDDLNEEKIEGNDKEVGKEIMSHETNEILKNASTENVKIKIDQQVLTGVSNEETVEENNKEVKKEFTPLENESNDILNNEKRSNKNIKIKKIVSSSNTTSPKNTNASTMKESHIKDKNDQFKKIPSHNLLLKTINVKIIGSNTITSSRNVKKALKRGSIALNDYSPTNKLSKNNDNEPLILSSHKNTETLKPSNNFLLSKRPLQNIDEKGTTLLSSPVPLSLNNNKKSKISSRNNFEASKSSEKTVLPNENDPNLKTSSQNTDSIIKTLPIEEIVLNDALRNKLLFETLEEDTNDNNENFIKYLEEQISKTVQFKNDIKSQIEESHRNFNNKYSNDFLSTKKNRKFTQSDLKTYSRSKTQRNTEKQPQLLNDDNKDTSDNDNHESKLLESSFELNPDPLSFDLKLSDGPPTDAILDDLPLNSNNCRPKSILSHPEIIGNTDSFENDVGSSDDGSVMDIFSLLSENIEIDLNEGEIPKNNDLDVQKEFETNETINNLPYINSYSIEGQHFHSFTIDNQKVSEHHKRLQKFDPCFAQPISDTIVQNTAPQHL